MKKGLATLLVIVVLFATVFASSDTFTLVRSEYPIYINGSEFDTGDLPPLNYEGNTYLPLRKVAEATGNDVDFVNNQIVLNNSKNLHVALSQNIAFYGKLTRMYTLAEFILNSIAISASGKSAYPERIYDDLNYLNERILQERNLLNNAYVDNNSNKIYIYDLMMLTNKTSSFNKNVEDKTNEYNKDTINMICNGEVGKDIARHLDKLSGYYDTLSAMSKISPLANNNDLFYPLFIKVNSITNDIDNCLWTIDTLSSLNTMQ